MGILYSYIFARMQRRLCRYGKRQMAGFYCCHKCMKYHKIHRKKYLISYFASGEPCIRILLRACGAAANLPGKSSLIGHTARNAPSRDAQARSSRISAKASVGRAIHPRFHLFPETVTPPAAFCRWQTLPTSSLPGKSSLIGHSARNESSRDA